MTNNFSCACIVPFYNEGERILRVLDVLTKVTNLSEVICVDGGSTDNESEQIQKHFSKVKLVRLIEGKGKSATVKRGLKEVKVPYVMLIDADLQNLKHLELEKAISTIQQNQNIDMLVLRRKHDPWFSKMVRGDITVTGERVMRTEDLRNVFIGSPVSYQLEFAINLYMAQRMKHVYWMYHSGINVSKIEKFGFFEGAKQEINMYRSIFAYAGILYSLRIMATFSRKEATTTS